MLAAVSGNVESIVLKFARYRECLDKHFRGSQHKQCSPHVRILCS